jgi:hypothetical protein
LSKLQKWFLNTEAIENRLKASMSVDKLWAKNGMKATSIWRRLVPPYVLKDVSIFFNQEYRSGHAQVV